MSHTEEVSPPNENADVEQYKNRMASLKPMERRTAQAFLAQGIEREYEWPLENETKDGAMIRKHFNAVKFPPCTGQVVSSMFENLPALNIGCF